jgi:hypothetical protein
VNLRGLPWFDKLRWQGMKYFIFGERTSGCFDLKQLDGTQVFASAKAATHILLERAKTFLIEKTMARPCGETSACLPSKTS